MIMATVWRHLRKVVAVAAPVVMVMATMVAVLCHRLLGRQAAGVTLVVEVMALAAVLAAMARMETDRF
jgi:hypothetical protein